MMTRATAIICLGLCLFLLPTAAGAQGESQQETCVVQSGETLTTYQAVSSYFRLLHQKIVNPGVSPYSAERQLLAVGVERQSDQSEAVLNASSRLQSVIDRQWLAEEMTAPYRDDPDGFKAAQREFHRRQVLDLADEFVLCLDEFERTGIDAEQLIGRIREWAFSSVSVMSTVPPDSIENLEVLAIERLFDEKVKHRKGGN